MDGMVLLVKCNTCIICFCCVARGVSLDGSKHRFIEIQYLQFLLLLRCQRRGSGWKKKKCPFASEFKVCKTYLCRVAHSENLNGRNYTLRHNPIPAISAPVAVPTAKSLNGWDGSLASNAIPALSAFIGLQAAKVWIKVIHRIIEIQYPQFLLLLRCRWRGSGWKNAHLLQNQISAIPVFWFSIRRKTGWTNCHHVSQIITCNTHVCCAASDASLDGSNAPLY